MDLFSTEKRRLGEDFLTMIQHLKGDCKDGGSLFPRSHVEKMRGNTHKLILGRSWLDIRGKFFTTGTISHWNSLPRDYSVTFCWIPQQWTVLRFSGAGCWTILSRPCFCHEMLDQVISFQAGIPWHYDSMVENHSSLTRNTFTLGDCDKISGTYFSFLSQDTNSYF